MPLTGHGCKLLQRNSAKFKWLARHRKSKILGNNMFAMDGEIYIKNKKYLS